MGDLIDFEEKKGERKAQAKLDTWLNDAFDENDTSYLTFSPPPDTTGRTAREKVAMMRERIEGKFLLFRRIACEEVSDD